MKLIKFLLLFTATLFVSSATAGERTELQMRQAAMSVLNPHKAGKNRMPVHPSALEELKALPQLTVYGYRDGGFAVISHDEQYEAVLGYSESVFVDTIMPCGLKWWIETSNAMMEEARGQSTILNKGRRNAAKSSIEPLLTSKWNQDSPYNQSCPDFFSFGKCITGCVATAMAQVMYYHRDKSVKTLQDEIPAYSCRTNWNGYGHVQVEAFPKGSVIDWDNMLDTYSSSASDIQKNAVANLMAYCGASVRMDYANERNGGSSASSQGVPAALITYFGYSGETTLVYRDNYTSSQWDDLVYAELSNGNPVYYRGSNEFAGHAFVCDGYDGKGYYHINWGWGGLSDGYFLLSALDPNAQGAGGSSSGYNSNQAALIGATPIEAIENQKFSLTYYVDGEVYRTYQLKAGGIIVPEPAPTKNGYTFSGWSDIPSTMPTHNVDVTGRFVSNSPSIINFADSEVKRICVENWDTDDDGEISYEEAKKVSSFGDKFKNTTIKSFDEAQYFTGIASIREIAFYHCGLLESIILPSSITCIEDGAFWSCSSLARIELPSNLETLGVGAFQSCVLLESVRMPASVTLISGGPFPGCTNLAHIYVDSSNPNYCSIDGVLFTKDKKTLVQFPNGKGTNYQIPVGTEEIGNNSFRYAKVHSVSVPHSVKSVDSHAFYGCRDLASIDISSVTSIGQCAFEKCEKLFSIQLSEDVTTIREYTFYDCIMLTDISLPNRLETIDDFSFSGCRSLRGVVIPSKVTSIGRYAFLECKKISSLTIGEGVQSISYQAFGKCSNLTDVYCYASAVPATETRVFEGVNTANVKLHVPQGKASLYKSVEPWKSFKVDEVVEETPTSVTIKMALASGAACKAIGYCCEYGLDFTNVDKVKAWTATGFTDTKKVILSLAMIVPPYTAVYIDTDEPGVEVAVPTTTSDVYYANLLLPIFEQQTVHPTAEIDGETYVHFFVGVLTNGDPGFVIVSADRSLGPNKALLRVPARYYTAAARETGGLAVIHDDEGTMGITLMEQEEEDASFYDLQGRRVAKPQKGLYVKNGRKVYIR